MDSPTHIPDNEDRQEEKLLDLHVVKIIEDIAGLYREGDVSWEVTETLRQKERIYTEYTAEQLRGLLLSLFENCYCLRFLEDIDCSLSFSLSSEPISASTMHDDTDSPALKIIMTIDEKSLYFFPDPKDSRYTTTTAVSQSSFEAATATSLRYLNGSNPVPVIASLEVANLLDFTEKYSGIPLLID